MAESKDIAGRSYAHVYRTSGRADVHRCLLEAVEAAGGRILYASPHTRAPLFLGVEIDDEERIGLLCYPFRATRNVTKNRPSDEHRLQVRYGSEESWEDEHALGFDVAGVDITLVLGVHPEAGIIVGLDPLLYDPRRWGFRSSSKMPRSTPR